MPVQEAVLHGAEKRTRPVVRTWLTAVLGLLPAALAQRPAWDPIAHFRLIEPIGVQRPRPLALAGCGVVGSKKASRVRTYELAPEALQPVADWLAAQRKLWEKRLDQLDTLLNGLKEQE